MAKLRMTVDEIVATLQKSRLPTILVEGSGDAVIYRWIEKWFPGTGVDVLDCNGRESLLELYRRKDEFGQAQVVFLADSDTWSILGVPLRYSGVIFTVGYSIENDVLDYSTLSGLLDPGEKLLFSKMFLSLTLWYSFEFEEYRVGRPSHYAMSCYKFMDMKTGDLLAEYKQSRGFVENFGGWVKNVIVENGHLLIRGKNLLAIYVSILSSPGRYTTHKSRAILEISLKLSGDNSYRDRLVNLLRSSLFST